MNSLRRRAATLAQVEDFIRMGTVDGTDDAVDNIGICRCNLCETIRHQTSVARDRGALVNELEGCHVGSSSGSVDGEEAKAGNVELVQVVVGVGEKLACLLGGGVRLNGIVDVLLFREEGRLGPTVDARRRGKDKVLDPELVT